jgi:hypothetical protein
MAIKNKKILFNSIFELTELYYQISKYLGEYGVDSFFLTSEKYAYKRLRKYGIPDEKIIDFSISIQELKKLNQNNSTKNIDNYERYGPSFSSIIMMSSRIYPQHLYKELYSYFNFICYNLENFLIKNKINFIIAEPTNAPEILTYSVAKKLGIKIGNIIPVRHPNNRIAIAKDIYESQIYNLEPNDENINEEDLYKWLNNFRKLGEEPIYMPSQKKSVPLYGLLKKIPRRLILTSIEILGKNELNYTSFKSQSKLYLRKYLTKRKHNKYFNGIEFVDDNRKYATYFLHVQPERTVDVISPYYSNQLEVIKSLRRALPSNIKLVVKEHPSFFGVQDKDFYRLLSKIPDVSLIDSRYNTQNIIKNSVFISTISGTVAMEASFLKIPSIIFSNVFFKFLPNIYKPNNYTELEDFVGKILNQEYKIDEYYDEKIITYLNYIYKNTQESTWDGTGGFKDTKTINDLVTLLIRWMNYDEKS